MRRLAVVLIFIIASVALAGGTSVGYRFDVSPTGDFIYKGYFEKELTSLDLFGRVARIVAGTEVYNALTGQVFVTAYTGYELNLPGSWVQVRVNLDNSVVPNVEKRFRVSLLGGFYW